MDRVVLHVDMNSYFASVEQMERPYLRGKPISVCGDVEKRHGIILASSIEAKRMYGIKTGNAVKDVAQKFPEVILVPARPKLYQEYSDRIHEMFCDYTDLVEGFGPDEAWLEIKRRNFSLEDGAKLADDIRARTWKEFALTCSVGVADNKMIAKFGSDRKKPNGTTLIRPEDMPTKVWPLPVGELMYVGPSAVAELNRQYIYTIGELAKTPTDFLERRFGIKGPVLKAYALGLDTTPVKPTGMVIPVQSVGHLITLPRDAKTREDAIIAIHMIAESVASKLLDGGFISRCISFAGRNTKLEWLSRQHTIKLPTALAGEIAAEAIRLMDKHCLHMLPMRSLGINCSSLLPATTPQQLDMFVDNERRKKETDLAYAVKAIRDRFGYKIIQRGVVLQDEQIAQINPREHTLHPVPIYTGK